MLQPKINMPCPICKTDTCISDTKMYLYSCKSCHHTFTKLPAGMQETYEGEYFEEDHKNWFENPNFQLFKNIEAELGKYRDINLLDVGCGKGDFLLWLHDRHPEWNLTGIDLAPNKHDTIKFITGDIFNVTFNKKFNVITSFMMVEHLDEIMPFIKNMRTLLEKDGIFIVNTFNTDSMIFRLAGMLKSIGIRTAFDRLYAHHHLQHYSNKSIRKIMTLGGFEIPKHKHHNYPLKAVDVPKSSKLIEILYKGAVGTIFLLSAPFGMGIEHTLICKPKS